MSRKRIVLIALMFAAGVVIAAMSSTNFFLDPVVVDQGGGEAASSNFVLQGSIGGPAIGSASSTNYKLEIGFIGPATSDNWLQISQLPTPDTIGPGISSEFKWISQKSGSFYIELGGDGSIGSGTQLRTGTCTATVEETETIAPAQLTDDASNIIYVIVDSGSGVLSKQVAIIDDETSPLVTLTQVAVDGTVDDATVTEVFLNGSSVTVTAGAYSGVVTTGMDSITVQATNGDGKSVTKTIAINQ